MYLKSPAQSWWDGINVILVRIFASEIAQVAYTLQGANIKISFIFLGISNCLCTKLTHKYAEFHSWAIIYGKNLVSSKKSAKNSALCTPLRSQPLDCNTITNTSGGLIYTSGWRSSFKFSLQNIQGQLSLLDINLTKCAQESCKGITEE